MKHTSTLTRQIPVLALALALGACTKARDLPPCPNIFALGDARQLDRVADGGTQIDYSVHLDGWTSTCRYIPRDQDWDVDVALNVNFRVKPGAANTSKTASFSYMAAIPHFFPNPAAKEVVPVSVQLDSDGKAKQVSDGPLHLVIPVHSDDAIDTYTIYLGLQLQPDELARNRKNP